MRLLIDVQGAQNDSRFRGIGRYVNALLLHLIRTKAKDDEIFLLLNGELVDGEREIRATYSGLVGPNNFKVWYPVVPAAWSSFGSLARRLASQMIREWAIRELSPDCVVVSSLFEGCADNVVTSIPPSGGTMTAVVFYDLIPFLFPHLYLGSPILQSWYDDKLNQLRSADLLLAISDASRQDVITHLGISEKLVKNVSSGIDAEYFCQIGASWQNTMRKYGISGRFLLYVGAADPRKNLDTFLRAFGSLPACDIRDVYIVMVGQITNDQKKSLRKIAHTFPGGAKQLIVVGHVSDGELIAFYRNALAFVFPSLHEGFGLPLLEAMVLGCPVIASNCSAFPEVVGLQEALFDPCSIQSIASKIHKVIVNQEFRIGLVQKQGERLPLFSWGRVADRVWSAIRELMAVKTAKSIVPEVVAEPSLEERRANLINNVADQLRNAGAGYRDFVSAAVAIERTMAGISS